MFVHDPSARQQELVGIRTFVIAAGGLGLIREKLMRSD